MPLAPVSTRSVKYKGCPPDCRHVVFVKPDGIDVAALLRVDPTWDVSLFVEEEFHRFFLVATSPDKEGLRIERWLPAHGPTILEATTQAEQAAALGGQHTGNATPAELADAAVAALTLEDTPQAIPTPPVTLMPMKAGDAEARRPKEKRGDYGFRLVGLEGEEKALYVECRAKGVLEGRRLRSKGSEARLVAAFCHTDTRSSYFLFDQGADYFLEALEWWGSTYRRREATVAKAAVGGLSNEDIVKAMVPNLAK